MRSVLAGCVVLLVTPSIAQSLFSVIENLFKSFTDVNAYWISAGFASRPAALTGGAAADNPKAWGLHGLGFEASFHVADFWARPQPPGATSTPEYSVDTTSIQIKRREGEPPETTFTVIRKKASAEDYRLSAELALGYSELRGFESAIPGLDLRGSLRELPAVSLYVTYVTDSPVTAYAGLRSGLAQLNNFRAFVG